MQDNYEEFSETPNGVQFARPSTQDAIGEEPGKSYFTTLSPEVAEILGRSVEDQAGRNVEALIRDYLTLREELRLVSKEFSEIEKASKDAMAKISMRLREIADDMGTDSLAVRGLGTAYRNVKVSYRARDWAAFIDWCKRHDNFHCIERRPAKLAVQEIHKATGAVPPGLDYFAEQEFNIRQSS